MVRQLGADFAKRVNYTVEAVRTSSTNEQTGAHECAAELHIHGPKGSNDIPIEYTVENTDDGKNIYVNVFGL
ncbi:hypothetical protein T35B1_17056 [Salinisphaera shabanensis T35B1]